MQRPDNVGDYKHLLPNASATDPRSVGIDSYETGHKIYLVRGDSIAS